MLNSPANFLTGLQVAEMQDFLEGNGYPLTRTAHDSQSLGFTAQNRDGGPAVMVADVREDGQRRVTWSPFVNATVRNLALMPIRMHGVA